MPVHVQFGFNAMTRIRIGLRLQLLLAQVLESLESSVPLYAIDSVLYTHAFSSTVMAQCASVSTVCAVAISIRLIV